MAKVEVTAEHRERGQKLANLHKRTSFIMNERGEFFTTENLAMNSVGGNKEKIVELDFDIEKENVVEMISADETIAVPNDNSNNDVIRAYLTENKIEFDSSLTKKELLSLIPTV